MPTLFKLGSIGSEVKLIQQALNAAALGLTALKIDGIFGQLTQNSTRKFQQRSSLSADGIVGLATLQSLSAFLPEILKLLAQITAPKIPLPVTPPPHDGMPKELTGYFKIDLKIGGKTPANTGIYLPITFRPGNTIDIVLFLHGIKTPEVNEYWSRRTVPAFHLRDMIFDSAANVALVVPTLGHTDGSFGGTLEKDPDDYLDWCLGGILQLMARVAMVTEKPPVIGNLVIGAHSGGGRPMFEIAQKLKRFAPNLRECWGFDSLYWFEKEWLSLWARANPTKQLFIHYTDGGGTKAHSEGLKAAVEKTKKTKQPVNNITVQKSRTASHNDVMRFHLEERLAAARFFHTNNAR